MSEQGIITLAAIVAACIVGVAGLVFIYKIGKPNKESRNG